MKKRGLAKVACLEMGITILVLKVSQILEGLVLSLLQSGFL